MFFKNKISQLSFLLFLFAAQALPVALFAADEMDAAAPADEAAPAAAPDEIMPPAKPAEEPLPMSEEEKAGQIKNDIDKYSVELGVEERDAREMVEKARTLFLEDKYEEARDAYIKAKQILESLNGEKKFNSRISAIDEALTSVYYYWADSIARQAEELSNEKQFDEAIAKCEEAKKISPSLKRKLDDRIEKYMKLKAVAKYRKETSEKEIMPNKDEKEYNLDVLFEQGKKYYEDGQYDKARDKFEHILSINPYHIKTIRYIKVIYKKLYDAGTKRYDLTIKERLTESEWEFVAPLLPRAFTGEKEVLEAPIEKKEGVSSIDKKLESIRIDHMEFEEVSIPVVVRYLQKRSKELDPAHEGVNIFLRLGGASAPPAEAAPAAVPEGGDAGGLEADLTAEDVNAPADVPTITMLVDDIPLIEAIKYICRGANLKWRVEKYAVVIAAQDVPLDELETRIYPIEQDSGIADAGDGAAAGGEGEGASTTASVQSYFQQRGVPFPEGARAVYDSRISRVIATNTPDNLEKIERIIKEMNVTDPQVLIEAKFVEIAQNDLNSLGFEWLVSKPSSLTNLSPSSYTFNQNDPLMRYSDDVSPTFSNGRDIVLNVVHHDSDGVTYQAMVHALETSNSTNILSTPRITTQNGEEATIRMVTEVYLPESWSEAQYIPGPPDIFTPSVPEFSDATELGVRLTVTPQVDADRYTIALDMVPVIQAHIGWIDYSYQVPSTTGGNYTNTIRMPIIEARTVQTQITIYDGETIVMGGVTRDNSGNISDQVPVLGEIPLIGRMFQSQVDDNQKRNLLIFTTVRLVQPDGSPYRAREIPGLPPFTQ